MDWNTIITQIFEVCIIPLLGVLTVFIIKLINSKTNEINATQSNEVLIKYTTMISNTITNCVIATNQTYVEALKKEGKFDLEAQQKAFKLTYNAVISILNEEAKNYIQTIYGDINLYITNLIEAEVNSNK